MEKRPSEGSCIYHLVQLLTANGSRLQYELLKLLEENWECPTKFWYGRNFQNYTLSVQKLRTTIEKLNLIKLKSFCMPKKTINHEATE